MNVDHAITTASDAAAALSGITAVFGTSSAMKALIGFNNGGKSYLFAANNDSGDTTIEEGELTLVAIVDSTFGDGDTVAKGVITFA